jgi:hypothetical protein
LLRRHRSPPRFYRAKSAALSPTNTGRRLSAISTAKPWSVSARSSPYIPASGLQDVRSSPPLESSSITKSDWRPTLPSLPSLTFDHEIAQVSRARSAWSEYALDSTPLGPPVSNSSFVSSIPAYQHASSGYGYQQPRGQLFSGPPTSHPIPHERTSFSNSHHAGYPGGTYPYGSEINEIGTDSKQRKRRGNLPKETTDKLRAWFVAHLQHPYPTEDEKQELMRQTGLQMSKFLMGLFMVQS